MKQLCTRFLFIVVIIFGLITAVSCQAESDLLPTPILPPPPELNQTATALNAGDEGESAATEVAEDMTETAVPDTEPTADPNETATPTLAPTPTLFPTATPVTEPGLTAVTAASLPAISRDLVFIADGSLKLWNHGSNQVQTLYGSTADASEARDTPFAQHVGDITQFSVSADGNRIVAARLTHSQMITPTVAEDEPPVSIPYTAYELLFLDVVSKDSWTIVPTITDLQDVAISSDQKQVAFIGGTLAYQDSPNLDAMPVDKHVFVISTPDGTTQPVAACTDFCGNLTWHPTNEIFSWTDRTGLWMNNLTGTSPSLMLTNQTETPGSTRVFQGISWAQNGRLLLLWQQAWEGGSRVVYDVPTGQLIPVPDTFVYAEPFPAEVSWMRDDRLLVMRSAISGSNRQATIELWRVNPDAGDIVLEESYQPAGAFSIAGGVHLENGRFAYALLNQDNAQSSGLYLQTSLSETPERVNGLIPAFIAPNVAWAPDGSGAIAMQGSYVLYAPVSGEGLFDVTAVFGSQPRDFVWLLPSNAPR